MQNQKPQKFVSFIVQAEWKRRFWYKVLHELGNDVTYIYNCLKAIASEEYTKNQHISD